MSVLHLYLLGVPRIALDDQPIHLDRQKALALLAYLAVTQRPHARDWLAELLWPEVTTGRTQLRIVLAALRKRLGTERFAATRDEIALARQGFWTDVDEFRRLSAGLLREEGAPDKNAFESLLALSAYDFMAGFSLRDAPEFDAWQRAEAQQVRWTVEQALAKCAAVWSKNGDFEAALAATRRRVALDPLNEDARRQMMTLYAGTARRPLAVQEYQQLKTLLGAELGLEPDAQTRALLASIQAGQGLAAVPPSRLSAAPPLPTVGKLFGREDALQSLTSRFASGARLVTILGPGGIGKTHLALELAPRLQAQFEDGVYFLRLDAEVSAEFLVSALMETLGQSTYRPGHALDSLIAYLRPRRLLVVIDNFHQVVEGAPTLHALLQMASGVGFLITSYEALRLTQEQRYPLHGLALPDAALGASAIGASPAVQLFVESARLVQPAFRLTSDNPAAMARICQQVQGMPLAILLAASWCDVLSVDEIAAEIAANYDFLRLHQHDLPERQRSLRSVFDTAWARLTPDEQTALRRLSVFQGSFNRAAAQGVAEVRLPLLKALVVKSLVTHHPQQQRYSLHDIFRPYARERLEAEPEAQAIVARYCQYFTEFLILQAAQIKGRLQQSAWRALDGEMPHLRAVWTLALERRDAALLNRLIEPLRLYLQTRDLWEQGVLLFEQARQVALPSGETPQAKRLRAQVLSRLYRDTGHAPVALEEALRLAVDLGDEAEIAHIQAELGWHFLGVDRCAEAQTHFMRAADAYRQQDALYDLALILRGLAYCALGLHQRETAIPCLNESLRLRRSIGDGAGEHDALLLRGEMALFGGDLDAAERDLSAVYRSVRLNASETLAMQQTLALGWLLLLRGDSARAAQFTDTLLTIPLTTFPAPIRCTLTAIRLLLRLVASAAPPAADLTVLEDSLDDLSFWNLNPDLRFLASTARLFAQAALGRRVQAIRQLQQFDAQGCFAERTYLAWIVPAALLLAASCAEPVAEVLLTFQRDSPVAALPWIQHWASFQAQMTALESTVIPGSNAASTPAVAAALREWMDRLESVR